MTVKSLISRYPIALAYPRSAYNLAIINSISFHHSVTANLSSSATEAQEIAVLDAFHRYHKSLGFGGIGYHLCVFPSGRIYLTCRLTQWGANVGGQNNHEIGICFVGTFTNVSPSHLHLVAGAKATDYVDKFLKRQVQLLGHNQYSGHESNICPGTIRQALPTLRSLIPTPAPTGIWGDVVPYSASVTLYENTNLINLETGAVIKLLPKGTKLAVAARYSSTHYLTVYSYTRRIPNGFAISATLPPPPPPPPTCAAEKKRIAELETALTVMTNNRNIWKNKADVAINLNTVYKAQIATLRSDLGESEARCKIAETIVQKLKDAHEALG